MKDSNFPPGWDEQRVQKLINHYERQSEDEAVAEDEAACEDNSCTLMEVPKELKLFPGILVIVIAVLSFIVSVKGCQISGSAKRTAESALETSRQQFVQLNRPYVTISPKKGSDDRYWNLAQQDKSVLMNIRYEVKNVGNVVAKDVRLPDKVLVRLGANLEEYSPATYKEVTAAFTLGPGQSCRVDIIGIIRFKTAEDAKENLKLLASDKKNGILISTAADYANELEKSQKYRTLVTTRFFSDRALLIKQEMISLTEEADESKSSNKPTQ